MRSIFFGFLVFAMWATFSSYYYVCEIKNNCSSIVTTKKTDSTVDAPTTTTKDAIKRENSLTLPYKGKKILYGFQQFHFDKGKIVPDLTKNNKEFLQKFMEEELFGNKNFILTITGYYRPSEKDMKSGFYENIGIARAAEIRDMLVDKGFESDRISLDFAEADSEDLKNPLSFEVFKKDKSITEDGDTAAADTDERVDEFTNKGGLAKVKFTFHDMTFSDANFEYDSDVFKPNNEFVAYADSVATYLELHPNKTLRIIGHTDAKGSDEYNDDLGLRRAQSVRRYMKETKDINSDILTDSKGKRNPMANNDSERNRKKNRRVNFVID